MKSTYVQYYVEGKDEVKMVQTLKSEMRVIRPGKVSVLNVVQNEITAARLMALQPGTMVVMIFDTDRNQIDILERNLQKLRSRSAVSDIVLIPQVKKLEEELVYSCKIRNITELLGSKSTSEFKRDLINVKNLKQKLQEHEFDLHKFWSRVPAHPYEKFANNAIKIKLIKK